MGVCIDAGINSIPIHRFDAMIRRTAIGFACVFACAAAAAQDSPGEQFAPQVIKKGADIYAQNCSACHGANMADPSGAFYLLAFPHDQKSRFINSVSKGKNGMPPWGDLLKSDDIESLWAYVMAGEKK
mgnify:CR=1 FL=1